MLTSFWGIYFVPRLDHYWGSAPGTPLGSPVPSPPTVETYRRLWLVLSTLKTKLSCKVRPQEQMRCRWVRRLNHWATATVLLKYWKTQAATAITRKALTRHSDCYSICQHCQLAEMCKQLQAVDWTLASLPGYARWHTYAQRSRADYVDQSHAFLTQTHGLLDYYNIDYEGSVERSSYKSVADSKHVVRQPRMSCHRSSGS